MAVPQISEESDTVELEVSTDDEDDVTQNNNVEAVDVETEEDELEAKLQELEKICGVLGIPYETKLDEFGTKVDKERVDEAVAFLRVTRDDNYNQMKVISDEIIKEWKACNTPFKAMYKISWITYIHDSTCADDVRGKNFLSRVFMDKAKKELASLQKDRSNKYKKKYLAQKKKLIEMLEEMHFTSSDVQFEKDKQVKADEYKTEKKRLKGIIQKLKPDAVDRKELVLRVELVKQAMYHDWPLDDIYDLIEKAKKIAVKMSGDAGLVPYDGQNVAAVLSKLHEEAISSAGKNKMTHGLRSGNLYKK